MNNACETGATAFAIASRCSPIAPPPRRWRRAELDLWRCNVRHQRFRSVCSGYQGARGRVQRRAYLGLGVRCRPPRASSWTQTSRGFRFVYSGRISAKRRVKFFESLLCCGVIFGGLWALRKAAKAICRLIGANHGFMLPHGELFINGSLQINTAPPQHAIFCRAGPRFNPKPQIASAVVKTTMAAPRCHRTESPAKPSTIWRCTQF